MNLIKRVAIIAVGSYTIDSIGDKVAPRATTKLVTRLGVVAAGAMLLEMLIIRVEKAL